MIVSFSDLTQGFDNGLNNVSILHNIKVNLNQLVTPYCFSIRYVGPIIQCTVYGKILQGTIRETPYLNENCVNQLKKKIIKY